MTMQLDPAGREFARWPVENPDALTLEFTVNGATWYPTLVDPDPPAIPTGFTGWVRTTNPVAGPAATGNPAGTAVLALGRNYATLRAIDSPEIVIRSGGAIDVE
jgi:hypothetical protein